MTNTDLKYLEKEIIEKLQNELPEHLYYHSAEHTKRVLEKVVVIADFENVSERDFQLLKLAALFHDIGFVKSSINHEALGCEMVKEFFDPEELKEEEIEKICGMIMATKIPQTPHNLLEEILADADLEYLGTEDFERISNYLYKEQKYINPQLTEERWTEMQINLMENHTYFTPYCRNFLSEIKQKHLGQLKEKMLNSAFKKNT